MLSKVIRKVLAQVTGDEMKVAVSDMITGNRKRVSETWFQSKWR